MQYFLNIIPGDLEPIKRIKFKFVGEKFTNGNLKLNTKKIELFKKNILPMNTASTRFVGPVYIKYIYESYLFLTGAFFDQEQKKTHIFTLKLGDTHLDVEGNQNIKILIDNTLNEFYKHLNIQISFNLGIDLLELLQFYTAILSNRSVRELAPLKKFTGLFEGADGNKCKRFITRVYDLLMEQEFPDIDVKLPDYISTIVASDETTLFKDKNNEYILSEPTDIYVSVKNELDLLPINMRNIMISSFLGFNSNENYPKISNTIPPPVTDDLIRSPLVSTENIPGHTNLAKYFSPLKLYGGASEYIINDEKHN